MIFNKRPSYGKLKSAVNSLLFFPLRDRVSFPFLELGLALMASMTDSMWWKSHDSSEAL